MTVMDSMEPAYKKQRRCNEEEKDESSNQELLRALEECRAKLHAKTQLTLELEAKVTTLEARVAELEAIYEWQGG